MPCGDRLSPRFPSISAIEAAAAVLGQADIRAIRFQDSLRDASRGDIVYLDPPYPPLNGTAYFTHYTMDRFGAEDQLQLAEEVSRLHTKGVKVLMTNADTPNIRKLYKHFRHEAVAVTRYVSSGKKKERVSEILITNF